MSALDRVAIFTNEYPPNVYGGAGVHVEYLSRALARLVPVEVRCFGEQNLVEGDLWVRGYQPWEALRQNTDPRFTGALDAFSRDLAMAKDWLDADLVHCHTWYTDMAGFLAKTLWNIPLVVTIHSLEPLRPWKVEQLGAAYHLSSWMERVGIEASDAVVAVSHETRRDVLRHFAISPDNVHVIHNGIDLHEYHPTPRVDALTRNGVDPERPYVLFVGRITRQKGIIYLVDAIPEIDPALQVVLLAGAPDTAEIAREMAERVEEARLARPDVIWIDAMLPRPEVIEFFSHAAVFCCPSVYEPFGIINLEAMACETAVVASDVGGIPEVVVPDETGLLVHLELQPGTFEPIDPARYAHELAVAINTVGLNPELQQTFGRNGRRRVEQSFSWDSIAQQTLALYQRLVAAGSG
ncbi:MAG TPA: glycogen synthase [Thermomicrobiaceae bacterium]|nr:glycogen synthase [Thermomicrobiaceae bacterium]